MCILFVARTCDFHRSEVTKECGFKKKGWTWVLGKRVKRDSAFLPSGVPPIVLAAAKDNPSSQHVKSIFVSRRMCTTRLRIIERMF